MRCSLSSVLALTLCSFSSLFLSPASAAPVEGDPQLVDVVLAAQEKSLAGLKRGRMKAVVDDRFAGETGTRATAEVLWNGAYTYWKFEAKRIDKDSSGELKIELQSGEMIETPAKLMLYWPGNEFAQIVADQRKSYWGQLRMRPDQCWFRMEDLFDLKQMLDPRFRAETLSKYVIVQTSNSSIIVERHYKAGGLYRFEVRMDKGGNVVRYDTEMGEAKKGYWRKGEYQWERHASGRWYVKRYSYVQSAHGDPEQPTRTYVVDVSEFEPNPVIPANRFKLDSLNIPQGTVISDVGRKRRRYRLGDAQGISQKVLDDLARRVREQSFASPKNQAGK